MSTSRNRKLGAIGVAVVALAGVGTAIAATSFHSHGQTTTTTASPAGGYADGGQRGLPPAGSGFGGRRFGGPGGGGSLSAAATYLGIPAQQLFTDIRSGKTLAQIAGSTSGKSAGGLIDAMVAAEKSHIDAAVKSGRITQAMATQIGANLERRVTRMVNGGFGRFGGRGGFGSPPSRTQPGTSPT